MSLEKRSTLTLPPRDQRVSEPATSEIRVEIGTIDVLLPCRTFDIAYKVAELGVVSPTLEFLLRLVKVVPGLEEAEIAQFFGFSLNDLSYVLNEATEPGYVERRNGRVWLRPSGEELFRGDSDEPKIFSVQERRRVVGFDLMSVAPQTQRKLDNVEMALPELALRDGAGRAGEKVRDRFRLFFRQITERSDRSRSDEVDLYSIDRITPHARFRMPVRIRLHSTLEDPNSADIDLSSWRDAHEVADRKEVESAAAVFAKSCETTTAASEAPSAYDLLLEFAPDFLREYTTRNGLSVRRYWREAATRAGEARVDRKTIPIAGALHLRENAERLLAMLDYGMRENPSDQKQIVVVAPQVEHWGATLENRELLEVLKTRLKDAGGEDPRSLCMAAGRPPYYIRRTFDEVACADTPPYPRAVEILLIPGTMCAVVVHSPIGDAAGYPVPLGFGSFDQKVVQVVTDHVEERELKYTKQDAL
ncbi:hypothetical protein MOV61_09405 [Neorhizobium sp. BETTINA12A]|uniref:hypothetical protein n=1 Tax=Neorhizobium sp. BETTINA12A TaxID=2908924 RepID=UPI001FF4B737|nr:hypothetical protein [Neorhizobium sp. BETTINA12A]MCJ9750930.1 hypothetical protein [Neorhizobium sp. BETTINA12A]